MTTTDKYDAQLDERCLPCRQVSAGLCAASSGASGAFASCPAPAPTAPRRTAEHVEHANDVTWTANEALIVQDDTGQIVFVNKPAATLFNATAQALEQMNVRTLAAQGHHWLNPAHLQCLSPDQPLCMHSAMPQAVGPPLLAEIKLERIKIDGRSYCLHTVRDLAPHAAPHAAPQRHTSEALRRLNTNLDEQVAIRTELLKEEVLLAQEKSKAKTAFLARMSHEIRTPIGVTIGLTDLALAHASDARQRDYLNKIRAAGSHLLSIIDDILDLSKIEANQLRLRPADFEFAPFFEGLQCLNQSAADKGLTLSLSSDPRLHRAIHADSGRLRQVLLNYLSNAIKFTQAGRITVHARLRSAPGGAPEILFEVADSGIGLTPGEIRRLFRPFYQAGNAAVSHDGGTGLGLSICKQLVELMGGRVGVNSVAGVGSTFWFQVPIEWGKERDKEWDKERGKERDKDRGNEWGKAWSNSSADAGKATVNGAQAREQLRRQVSERGVTRVLVADDNKVNQQIVLEMLAPCGIETVLADNGLAALQTLARQRIDCILMDLHMPVMDGYAALHAIRRNPATAALPVIALTADVLGDAAWRRGACGADAILTKPFSPRALYQHVSDALARAGKVPDPADQSANPFGSMGGDPEALLHLRALFLLVALDCAAQIRKACAARQRREIARQTHKLLPSARMLNAREVARLCTELDSLLAVSDWRQIEHTVAALDQVLEQMGAAQSTALPPRVPWSPA